MMAGAMKRSRTSGLRLRRPALSPSELSPRELRVRDVSSGLRLISTSRRRSSTPLQQTVAIHPASAWRTTQIHRLGVRSRQWDSNPQPGVYKTPARPIEQCRPVGPEEGSDVWVRRLALASSGPSPEEASRLTSLERHPRRVRPARYRTCLPTATHDPDLHWVAIIGTSQTADPGRAAL